MLAKTLSYIKIQKTGSDFIFLLVILSEAKMTDIEKIIKMLFPEIMKLIDTQKNSELEQKELDIAENPSIHTIKKGVENGRK